MNTGNKWFGLFNICDFQQHNNSSAVVIKFKKITSWNLGEMFKRPSFEIQMFN